MAEQKEISGLLEGRLEEISQNSSGHYSLVLSRSVFFPEEEEGISPRGIEADRVLVYFPSAEGLEPGIRLQVRGTLSLFEGADNPGQFDPRAYYGAKNLYCRMEAAALRISGADFRPLERAAFRVRLFLRQGLERIYPPREAGILSAMLLGERSRVDRESEALYELAGISHLLSVSGLHVSFWATLIGRFCGLLLTLFPLGRGRRLLARRGYSLLRAALAAAGVVFYMMLCGTKTPVQRAGLMAVIYQLSQGFGLSFDLPSALGAAALAALIPAPEALFQSSFQLSFGCVFLLGCLLPLLSKKLLLESRGGRAVLVPLLLQMGMLPVTLWHFFTFHPYSLPANLLAVPLAGLILAGGFVSALLAFLFPAASRAISGGVRLLLELIRQSCLLWQSLPEHSLVMGRPSGPQILCYIGLALGGIAWTIHIRKKEVESFALQLKLAGQRAVARALREVRSTALLLLLWLLGAASLFLIPPAESLQIASLYVGQGDGQVISLPNGRHYLLDGGGGSDTIGERVLLPYLRSRGIRHLSGVLVSHPDSDHINGLEALLEAPGLSVGLLAMPEVFRESEQAESLREAARRAGVPLRYLKAGDVWKEGDVRFRVLYPGGSTQVDENESSLVLRLEYGDFSALFPGDLGELGEEMLLKAYGEELESVTLLKVGHHGSRFSSSEAFLERLQPRLALISCGRDNRYGHPAEETLHRLEQQEARILRTDEWGAVEISVGKEGDIRQRLFHEKETDHMQKKQDSNKEEKKARNSLLLSA
ncbi:MAG: DNA internalization-related competence protein ComEC/Rec2, partial [Lachnospiraceae bacterium]|nr:DNA internalization-related competence protein ComEC/Rec2 [Lachnospiraceae bacterium]